MFIKPWRLGLLCAISVCHLNVISCQNRPYPWKLFHNSNRRILNGVDAAGTRPYMVYLRPDPELAAKRPNWLCGGVIIHEFFVLTSAACIEDVKRFYVVSGTYKWVPPSDDTNDCIKNGAVRAVWKCVPKSYVFDGKQFENIRWMMFDLAIVRVEEPFNFGKRVRGCDFIPSSIRYNNYTDDLEKPGTVGSIAGWGSTLSFGKGTKKARESTDSTNSTSSSTSSNSPVLLETDVLLISKKKCKSRWPVQHHAIIDQHMICAKSTDSKALGSLCMENDLNCKDIVYEEYEEAGEEGEGGEGGQGGEGGGTVAPDADEENPDKKPTETPEAEVTEEPEESGTTEITEADNTRRFLRDYNEADVVVHGAKHDFEDGRRAGGGGGKGKYGGFCENDHGGPLIVGRGKEAVVVGIISACMSKPRTHECYGPFLFTSIFKYKHLIACATEKVEGAQQTSHACRNALRSTKTDLKRVRFDWTSSKRLMSAEEFFNSSAPNRDDMPSNEADTHEKTRREAHGSVRLTRSYNFDSSAEEANKSVANSTFRRSNPLYDDIKEIGDDGRPVISEDLKLNRKADSEPINWKKERKRARVQRVRKVLGYPVTDTVGLTIRGKKPATEKYFPVVTYKADSASNFHDVDGHQSLNKIRKRKLED